MRFVWRFMLGDDCVDRTAIAVTAYDRPPFLYVTLSSVFRMQGIEHCPVYVFVDKVSPGLRSQMDEMFTDFPIAGAVFREQRLHYRWNLLLGLRELFDMGYDWVVYFQDDHIVCTDTLDKIDQAPMAGFFLALSTWFLVPNGYCPFGNVIGKKNFEMLYEWVRDRKFIGERATGGEKIYMDGDNDRFIYGLTNNSTDYLFQTFLDVHGLESQRVGEPLVAHFGVFGMNFGKLHQWVHSGTLMADIGWTLWAMFRGDKSRWLDNVAALFNEGSIPEGVRGVFIPEDFRYY